MVYPVTQKTRLCWVLGTCIILALHRLAHARAHTHAHMCTHARTHAHAHAHAHAYAYAYLVEIVVLDLWVELQDLVYVALTQ